MELESISDIESSPKRVCLPGEIPLWLASPDWPAKMAESEKEQEELVDDEMDKIIDDDHQLKFFIVAANDKDFTVS